MCRCIHSLGNVLCLPETASSRCTPLWSSLAMTSFSLPTHLTSQAAKDLQCGPAKTNDANPARGSGGHTEESLPLASPLLGIRREAVGSVAGVLAFVRKVFPLSMSHEASLQSTLHTKPLIVDFETEDARLISNKKRHVRSTLHKSLYLGLCTH